MVIAVIAILGTITLASVNSARMKARDVDRVVSLKEVSGALALYYIDNKKYPDPVPVSTDEKDFVYGSASGGTCNTTAPGTLNFEDANSGTGLLQVLVTNKYLSKQWSQPSTPADDKFLCRYVVTESEVTAGNIQHYLLHCNLENDTKTESSDGGLNDTVYEIYSSGTPQFCLSGIDGVL